MEYLESDFKFEFVHHKRKFRYYFRLKSLSKINLDWKVIKALKTTN